MGRKLFVGNLPFQTAESDLQDLFSPHGDVESVRVMRDMATGRARGFAFVEMVTEEGAAAAATSLDGTQFNGRAIAVNEARPKPAFGGRSDDRGFGGGNGRRRSEPRW